MWGCIIPFLHPHAATSQPSVSGEGRDINKYSIPFSLHRHHLSSPPFHLLFSPLRCVHIPFLSLPPPPRRPVLTVMFSSGSLHKSSTSSSTLKKGEKRALGSRDDGVLGNTLSSSSEASLESSTGRLSKRPALYPHSSPYSSSPSSVSHSKSILSSSSLLSERAEESGSTESTLLDTGETTARSLPPLPSVIAKAFSRIKSPPTSYHFSVKDGWAALSTDRTCHVWPCNPQAPTLTAPCVELPHQGPGLVQGCAPLTLVLSSNSQEPSLLKVTPSGFLTFHPTISRGHVMATRSYTRQVPLSSGDRIKAIQWISPQLGILILTLQGTLFRLYPGDDGGHRNSRLSIAIVRRPGSFLSQIRGFLLRDAHEATKASTTFVPEGDTAIPNPSIEDHQPEKDEDTQTMTPYRIVITHRPTGMEGPAHIALLLAGKLERWVLYPIGSQYSDSCYGTYDATDTLAKHLFKDQAIVDMDGGADTVHCSILDVASSGDGQLHALTKHKSLEATGQVLKYTLVTFHCPYLAPSSSLTNLSSSVSPDSGMSNGDWRVSGNLFSQPTYRTLRQERSLSATEGGREHAELAVAGPVVFTMFADVVEMVVLARGTSDYQENVRLARQDDRFLGMALLRDCLDHRSARKLASSEKSANLVVWRKVAEPIEIHVAVSKIKAARKDLGADEMDEDDSCVMTDATTFDKAKLVSWTGDTWYDEIHRILSISPFFPLIRFVFSPCVGSGNKVSSKSLDSGCSVWTGKGPKSPGFLTSSLYGREPGGCGSSCVSRYPSSQ